MRAFHRAVAFALLAGTLAVHAVAGAPADFAAESPSPNARKVADWAAGGDSRGLPFIVVDKVESRVFVFDAVGRLRGAAPALVGMANGDESVPGIGGRAMSTITPAERTTPAGRFVAAMGKTTHGDEILWVDYDSAVALHRVIATVAKERRLQRLASRDPQDRRITYGCINVPVKFFDAVVLPAFRKTAGIVYVLPETRPVGDVFKFNADVTPPAAVPPSPRSALPASAPGLASSRWSRTTES